MKVQNMTGRSGKPVVNQFIIDAGDRGLYFQSYNTVIAHKSVSGCRVWLDRNKWDYSTTTGKYRNQFLGETKKETQAKIDSGEYTLADLN